MPLIAHWDGAAWDAPGLDAPDQTAPPGLLNGVAALSPTDILAVGSIPYSGDESTGLTARQECR